MLWKEHIDEVKTKKCAAEDLLDIHYAKCLDQQRAIRSSTDAAVKATNSYRWKAK